MTLWGLHTQEYKDGKSDPVVTPYTRVQEWKGIFTVICIWSLSVKNTVIVHLEILTYLILMLHKKITWTWFTHFPQNADVKSGNVTHIQSRVDQILWIAFSSFSPC